MRLTPRGLLFSLPPPSTLDNDHHHPARRLMIQLGNIFSARRERSLQRGGRERRELWFLCVFLQTSHDPTRSSRWFAKCPLLPLSPITIRWLAVYTDHRIEALESCGPHAHMTWHRLQPLWGVASIPCQLWRQLSSL